MGQKFKIDHIDPLGQGVSKLSDKVSFIRKTLPGEKGEFNALKSSKGVVFGEPDHIDQVSPLRIQPDCPHFFECPSCHFLHTDQTTESSIKQKTLEREILKRLQNSALLKEGLPKIKLHGPLQRNAYRNRIQLHYDLKKKRIGYIDPLKKRIVEVPQCMIGTSVLQEKLRELYHSQKWMQLMPSHSPTKGHLELIERSNEAELVWNSRYASGGFTQVNQQMNETLVELVTNTLKRSSSQQGIWDLFGGEGNLTQRIQDTPVLVADSHQNKSGQEKERLFLETDLYSDGVLEDLLQKSPFTPDTLLLDPPRSGFKQLKDFLTKLKPQTCLYVSCHQATQLRDLQDLPKNYRLKEVHLLELFPATYHFETVFLLQINDDKR